MQAPRWAPVALAVLLPLTAARPANAAEAIYLHWNDCPLGPAMASDLADDCTNNSRRNSLIASFTLGTPVDSVLAAELTIDVQHADNPLPAWWQFGTSPCRAGALKANADFTGLIACEDLWQGLAVGGLQQFTVGQPRGLQSQARIRVALAVTFDKARTLNATSTYYAAHIVLEDTLSTGPGTCLGCGRPACLVLNTILLGRPPRPAGAPSGDVLLEIPGALHGNWVTWQGGAGASCDAVPVRRRTWGEVKSIYRW